MTATHEDLMDNDGVKTTEIVEKRVRSTVIRRRARPVAATAPKPTEAPAPRAAEVADEAATASAPSSNKVKIIEPAAPVEKIVTPVEVTPATPKPQLVAPKTVSSGRVKVLKEPEPQRPRIIQETMPAGASAEAAPGAVPRPVDDAKAHKPLRKKKSRAEWEGEDIKRAGGLLEFAAATTVTEDSLAGFEGEFAEGAEEASVETSESEVEALPVVPQKIVAAPRLAPVERVFRPTGGRRKRGIRRDYKKTVVTSIKASKRIIRVEAAITVGDLSQRMGVRASDLVRQLMDLDIAATVNQSLDVETATLLAQEHGYEIEHTAIQEDKLLTGMKKPCVETPEGETRAKAEGEPRPPVVAVMGHVDHGKTSLLDVIRSTGVAEGEAGGITQHIGASEIETPKGVITFLDTPGHEAFTALRARGAQVTDLVVLVVAADDGVMPQTIEAINHAKAAGVPLVVAINKMDRADADPDRVKRELSEHGVVTEEWGGDAICIPTSAKTKEGIDQLLEMILLQAEVLELRANTNDDAQGTVVEARLEKGRGAVATVLVTSGTLKLGAPIVCGACFGRVRALTNPAGKSVHTVGPGYAAELLGLNAVPTAGDEVTQAADDKSAKLVAESRARKSREAQMAKNSKVSLEDLQAQMLAGELKTLNLVIKGDVQGSVEAVVGALERLGNDELQVKILHQAVGGITESDVMLAKASQAIIIGFNIAPESKARRAAEQEKVEIKSYSIIYELIDELKLAMEGLLTPTEKEEFLGRADVREAFQISKVGTIAGSVITEGKITRGARVRLLRDSAVVFEGKLSSLKRFKDDAKEVLDGYECGIGLDGFNDVKPGDQIEAFLVHSIAGKL